MKSLILILVTGYQKLISPFLHNRCRFYPSCSHYGLEAIREHGSSQGLILLMRRLLKCHPFGPSGIDPVPRHNNHLKIN